MDTYFHFPPDLFNLLVDTIPRLNKSKKDLLLFLTHLNQSNEKMLGVRRRLLQRVIEFDAFETCYPNDKNREKDKEATRNI